MLERLTVLVLIVASGAAEATAERPSSSAESPWSRGVSEQQQQEAMRLLEQGNELFVRDRYARALAIYRQAVAQWDHPAIHYNIAECEMNLGRTIQAYRSLQRAMRYQEVPLGQRLYHQAKTYLKLLEQSLARLVVVCEQPGTKVALDGRPLFTAPGRSVQVLPPGPHALLAEKPGYITSAKQANLQPGQEAEVRLELVAIGEKIVYQRRWTPWIPWAVLAGGLTTAAAALPLYLSAHNDFNEYDREVQELCGAQDSGGCSPDDPQLVELDGLRSGATTKKVAAISLLTSGGVIAATGIALLILNLPRPQIEGEIDRRASISIPGSSLRWVASRGFRLVW